MREANDRQRCALTFCAATVPAIVILPRAGWLWGGLAAVGTALLVLLARRNTAQLVERVGQTVLGKAALTLLLLWNLLLLGAGARLLCGVFPRGNVLIGLLLLLLSAYSAARGIEVLARVGAICFFFLFILYSILFGFSLPDLKAAWLAPMLRPDWRLLPAALVPMLALWLPDRRGACGKWLLGGVVLTLLAGIVTAGSLSPELAAQEQFPFYTAAKSVSIFGAMERLEPVVSSALTAGGFCLLGLICAVNGRLLAVLAPKIEPRAAVVNFLSGGTLLWGSSLLSGTALALGTAIFWGAMPILLPLVVPKEKS